MNTPPSSHPSPMSDQAGDITPSHSQEQAIERGHEHFQSNDRGLLVGACGSGKTLVSVKITEKFPAGVRRVLVTVPTKLLLKQCIDDWRKHFNPEISPQFVAVCSDQTVEKKEGDLSTEELERELEGGEVSVTTDPEELRGHLEGGAPDKPLIVVSTYASAGPVVSRAQKGLPKEKRFDILIADEAHHTAGEGSKKKVSREYQVVLDNKKIDAARRLFLTATPRVVRPKARKDEEGKKAFGDFGLGKNDLFSMDDEAVYGRTFFNLTLAQAIEDPKVPVADYRLVPHYVRLSDLRFALDPENGLPFAGLEPSEAAAAYAYQDLADHHPNYQVSKTITYHQYVKGARRFQEAMDGLNEERGEEGKVHTGFLDGKLPIEERQKVLDHFSSVPEDERAVVSNCKALTEGANVSGANALIFADAKGSPVEVMQAIGRILRREGNPEKLATVIIPLIVDDETPGRDGTPEFSLEASPQKLARLRQEAKEEGDPLKTAAADSALRFRRLMFAAKCIDAEVGSRIEIPGEPARPHPGRTFGQETPEKQRIASQVHEARGRYARKVVEEFTETVRSEVRGVTGSEYADVYWNEDTGYWEARLRNDWKEGELTDLSEATRKNGTIFLGERFEDSEKAAMAVDTFIQRNGLSLPMNFGHNPHWVKHPENATSRYPEKISFSPERAAKEQKAWRAYIEQGVPIRDTSGNAVPAEAKINCYKDTEMEAILAHDALCERYGVPERKIDTRKATKKVRWDLITTPKRAVKGEFWIEREVYHPDREELPYWVYGIDDNGDYHQVGLFPDLNAAVEARNLWIEQNVSAEQVAELANKPTRRPPGSSLRSAFDMLESHASAGATEERGQDRGRAMTR